MNRFHFQYCQKIVVFSKDKKKVLLCKRKDEQDFDSMFSFIGGKMETTDKSIIEGLKREKDEEVGENFKIKIFTKFSSNIHHVKKDGNSMILPHYLSFHESGEINLSEEYSEYKWVDIMDLESFEPKIPNIPQKVKEMLEIEKLARKEDYVLI
jgi:ADP-ribose pyrophosphatase YjhB (NUDIX family)